MLFTHVWFDVFHAFGCSSTVCAVSPAIKYLLRLGDVSCGLTDVLSSRAFGPPRNNPCFLSRRSKRCIRNDAPSWVKRNTKLHWPPTLTHMDFKESGFVWMVPKLKTLKWRGIIFAYYPPCSAIALLLVGTGFDRQVPAIWVSALLPAYLWGIMWHFRLCIKSQ